VATIIQHLDTGNQYFLVGSGFGLYRSQNSSLIGGDMFPNIEEGNETIVIVSDKTGNLCRFHMDEVKVISIDGLTIEDAASQLKQGEPVETKPAFVAKPKVSLYNYCPSCGRDVDKTWHECMSCNHSLTV